MCKSDSSDEFKKMWRATCIRECDRLAKYSGMSAEMPIGKSHFMQSSWRDKILKTRNKGLDFDLGWDNLPSNIGISSMKYVAALTEFEKWDTYTGHKEIWCIWNSGLTSAYLTAGDAINILAAGVGGIGKSRAFNISAALLVDDTYKLVGRGTAMAMTGERRALVNTTQIHHEPMASLVDNGSKGGFGGNPDHGAGNNDTTQVFSFSVFFFINFPQKNSQLWNFF